MNIFNNTNLYGNSKVMIQKRLIKEALSSIWSQRGRSLLTSLGIIIGAATIILVVDFGEGAKISISRQYSNLSVTTIFINAPSSSDGVKSELSYEDSQVIRDNAKHVYGVSPLLTGKVAATNGTNSEQINVAGVSTDFEKLSNLSFTEGSFFTDEQEATKQRVVVLGSTAAELLFGEDSSNLVDQKIIINKKSYDIVGVLPERGGSFGPLSIDESIFMPFLSAEKYALTSGAKMSINASAVDLESIDIAMEEISSILRDEHRIPSGGVDDFKLKDMGSNVVAAEESARTMSLLLSSVAAVVSVVGGIGIMNVMYINVTERTKEIGLRKALGAKRKQILTQFLAEAIIISFAGSVIGAIVGISVYPIMVNLGLDIVHSWWGVFLAVGFSLAIGVSFGYYPAKKAAELNPIEALRYE